MLTSNPFMTKDNSNNKIDSRWKNVSNVILENTNYKKRDNPFKTERKIKRSYKYFSNNLKSQTPKIINPVFDLAKENENNAFPSLSEIYK